MNSRTRHCIRKKGFCDVAAAAQCCGKTTWFMNSAIILQLYIGTDALFIGQDIFDWAILWPLSSPYSSLQISANTAFSYCYYYYKTRLRRYHYYQNPSIVRSVGNVLVIGCALGRILSVYNQTSSNPDDEVKHTLTNFGQMFDFCMTSDKFEYSFCRNCQNILSLLAVCNTFCFALGKRAGEQFIPVCLQILLT